MRQDRLTEKAEQRREQAEQEAARQAILDDMRAQVAPQVDIDPARLVQDRVAFLQLKSKIAAYFFQANFDKSSLFWVYKILSS